MLVSQITTVMMLSVMLVVHLIVMWMMPLLVLRHLHSISSMSLSIEHTMLWLIPIVIEHVVVVVRIRIHR